MVCRTTGLFGILTATLLAGCARNSPTPPSAVSSSAPVSSPSLPTDDLGRSIALQRTPRRIVCLAPAITETVFALGEGKRVVGRDQYSNFPAAAAKLPEMADFSGPFFEEVVQARPDLLIEQGETYDTGRIELWERKCGVPVALLQPKSVKDVQSGIKKIAAWLGVPQKAAALNKTFPAAKPASQIKVFFELGRVPLWSAGRDTLIGDEIATLGYRNVADIEGYKAFNLESLVKADPDVYIVTAEQPNKARALAELRKIPSLRGLRCIEAGRLAVIPADWLLRPGPRMPLGMKELARQVGALTAKTAHKP